MIIFPFADIRFSLLSLKLRYLRPKPLSGTIRYPMKVKISNLYIKVTLLFTFIKHRTELENSPQPYLHDLYLNLKNHPEIFLRQLL